MLRIDRKIVIVTRLTQLGALRRKFSTRSQAKFQIVSAKRRELSRSRAGAAGQIGVLADSAFAEIERAAETYDEAVARLRADLEESGFGLPVQVIDREFLPNFVFGPNDIIVTVGQDGLVANAAKYVAGLPIVAVNPDPKRIDGILLPFVAAQAGDTVRRVLQGKAAVRQVTLAEAQLADGQRLLAFNELFIGCRTHVSARYRLNIGKRWEPQTSSGLLVSTGAGSTGWLSSVFNMAGGIERFRGQKKTEQPLRLGWEDPRLIYMVREPFLSKSSTADLVAGFIEPGQEIVIESEMPSDGVIFSDGVESDYLQFNAGAIARTHVASKKATLVQ